MLKVVCVNHSNLFPEASRSGLFEPLLLTCVGPTAESYGNVCCLSRNVRFCFLSPFFIIRFRFSNDFCISTRLPDTLPEWHPWIAVLTLDNSIPLRLLSTLASRKPGKCNRFFCAYN